VERATLAEVHIDSREVFMFPIGKKLAIFSLLVTAVTLLGACAAQEPIEYGPRPDMGEIALLLDCPSDRTPACLERMGKPYKCYCMDKDALRRLMEPDKY